MFCHVALKCDSQLVSRYKGTGGVTWNTGVRCHETAASAKDGTLYSRAHPLNPAALAFEPFGIVLVRVRVERAAVTSNRLIKSESPYC